MNIEKKKITGTKQFSIAAKNALAASLGMMAAFTLNACDDTSSAHSDSTPASSAEDSQPSSSSVKAASDSSAPAETKQDSSKQTEATQDSTKQTGAQQTGTEQKEAQQNNTEQPESQKSSSSKAVEIPLSHEPISSSLMEALSAAAESSSSAASPDTSATAPESSSETAQPASSSDAPSSSSAPASSSSNNGWGPAHPNPCEGLAPGDTTTYDSQIIICPSSSSQDPWSQGWSMVITFEKTDIEV